LAAKIDKKKHKKYEDNLHINKDNKYDDSNNQ